MWNGKNHDDLGNIMEKEIEYQDVINNDIGDDSQSIKDTIADGILLKEIEDYKPGIVLVLKHEDVKEHDMPAEKFCAIYHVILFVFYIYPLRLGHAPASNFNQYEQDFLFKDEFYEAKLSGCLEFFRIQKVKNGCMLDINNDFEEESDVNEEESSFLHIVSKCKPYILQILRALGTH